MAARPDGDLPAFCPRPPHAGRDVGGVGGAQHGGRPPGRTTLVEDPADGGGAEPLVATAEELSGEGVRHQRGIPGSVAAPSAPVTPAWCRRFIPCPLSSAPGRRPRPRS